jgi:hypothetical protein
MGEQQLKNIARVVHVYRIPIAGSAAVAKAPPDRGTDRRPRQDQGTGADRWRWSNRINKFVWQKE